MGYIQRVTCERRAIAMRYALSTAALLTLSACTDGLQKTTLEKQTQLCEKKLSAIIDPDVFVAIDPQGLPERAIITAARIHMEPSRKEPISDNIRLIITKPVCNAYDRAGNILGEYTMVLSTDKLSWWITTDDTNELSLTKMVQKFDKRGTPLNIERKLRFTLKQDKQEIEITRHMPLGEEKTRTFASYNYIPESRTLKITTENRILEFADDGRLKRSVYCYKFNGLYCQDPTTWDVHHFQYDNSGRLIGTNGIDEGVDYEYKREFALNERGNVILERYLSIDNDDGDSVWEERRILYYD